MRTIAGEIDRASHPVAYAYVLNAQAKFIEAFSMHKPVGKKMISTAIAGLSEAAAFPVVATGASAGGLDACRKFLGGLPAHSGIAFILVQHLDLTHASMLVELLAGKTALEVCEAIDGEPIEREHLYVIPPGVYLSVSGGALKLSPPEAPHGARLPFDFLLQSLAEEYASR